MQQAMSPLIAQTVCAAVDPKLLSQPLYPASTLVRTYSCSFRPG
ncbi:MAG: hypothetical protein ACE5DI_02310 [Candidatus Micrarchaeia archaeon]